jgi:hypothetical protein
MESVKATVQDELSRRAMLQREVQMAVNIAKARDTIWIFGSAWTALTAGVATAHALGRPVPGVAGVPVVVGALVLGNLTDMAYGNKLARVSKEAEYILEYERGRFVPFRQAPFSKFYSEEERASLYKPATAVGELFPNYWWARHHPLPGPSGESK